MGGCYDLIESIDSSFDKIKKGVRLWKTGMIILNTWMLWEKNLNIFFDRYEPVSIDDKKAILDAMEKEIGITVDGVGRVWTEAGCYIADVIINY